MNYRPKLDRKGRMRCCPWCLKRGTVEYLNTDMECTTCLALIEPREAKVAPPLTADEKQEAKYLGLEAWPRR